MNKAKVIGSVLAITVRHCLFVVNRITTVNRTNPEPEI